MGIKHTCRLLLRGFSVENFFSMFKKTDLPPPRCFDLAPPPQSMGDFIPGLVSFIVPTLHRKKAESVERLTQPLYTLRELLRDIHSNVTIPFEVVVVCNEVENRNFINFIETSPHITRYCINGENAGVPRSWNIGVQLAKGEFLCFVNDDVEIGPGAVERLVETLATRPQIGITGPAGALWYRQEPGPAVGTEREEKADAIGGWLFMTPRKVFFEVGGFDTAYTPALVEEIDYAFAVRSKGYKCLVVPGLRAVHHHVSGASSSSLPLGALGYSLERQDLTARNRAYFEEKWKAFWEGEASERP